MDIIMYLIQLIQYQHKQICWLINFICKYIPLKQWAFDDSHSPKYQKFKIDELPKIDNFKQEWNNGKKKSQLRCKICQTHFSPTEDNRFSKTTKLRCPHCSHTLVPKKDLNSLPKNASSLKFSKFDSHVMSLCLTLHVNLGLSLRKTKQALKDLYNISISHQQIANYCKPGAICIKPFVDNYN